MTRDKSAVKRQSKAKADSSVEAVDSFGDDANLFDSDLTLIGEAESVQSDSSRIVASRSPLQPSFATTDIGNLRYVEASVSDRASKRSKETVKSGIPLQAIESSSTDFTQSDSDASESESALANSSTRSEEVKSRNTLPSIPDIKSSNEDFNLSGSEAESTLSNFSKGSDDEVAVSNSRGSRNPLRKIQETEIIGRDLKAACDEPALTYSNRTSEKASKPQSPLSTLPEVKISCNGTDSEVTGKSRTKQWTDSSVQVVESFGEDSNLTLILEAESVLSDFGRMMSEVFKPEVPRGGVRGIKSSRKGFDLSNPDTFGKPLVELRTKVSAGAILRPRQEEPEGFVRKKDDEEQLFVSERKFVRKEQPLFSERDDNVIRVFEPTRKEEIMTVYLDDSPPQLLKVVEPRRKAPPPPPPPAPPKRTHYIGDECSLHDPAYRGRQILALQELIQLTTPPCRVNADIKIVVPVSTSSKAIQIPSFMKVTEEKKEGANDGDSEMAPKRDSSLQTKIKMPKNVMPVRTTKPTISFVSEEGSEMSSLSGGVE